MNLLYLFSRHKWGNQGVFLSQGAIRTCIKLQTHLSDEQIHTRDIAYRCLPQKTMMKLLDEVVNIREYVSEVADCDDRADSLYVRAKDYYVDHCWPGPGALALGYTAFETPRGLHAGVCFVAEGDEFIVIEPVGLKVLHPKVFTKVWL